MNFGMNHATSAESCSWLFSLLISSRVPAFFTGVIDYFSNSVKDYRPTQEVLNEMKGVLGHHSALLRLYWAGDNLG